MKPYLNVTGIRQAHGGRDHLHALEHVSLNVNPLCACGNDGLETATRLRRVQVEYKYTVRFGIVASTRAQSRFVESNFS